MRPKEKQDWLPTQFRKRGRLGAEPLPDFELRCRLALHHQEIQIFLDPRTNGTRMEFLKLRFRRRTAWACFPCFSLLWARLRLRLHVRLFSEVEMLFLARCQPMHLPRKRCRILNPPGIQSCAIQP